MRKILQSSLLLLVVLVCVPVVSQAAGEASYSGSTERSVLALLNDIRHEHGLPAFVASTALRGAAREHSSDMLTRGYFEHDSAKESFDKRIRRFLKSPLVAENIVSLWMHSPPHRRIILMSSLHRVGLGVAKGSFEGNTGAVMATADFSA